MGYSPLSVGPGVEEAVFKRLREEWLYWRYRNITRRWLLLKPRLRARRHQPSVGTAPRARGTAMFYQTRVGTARGLVFVVLAAAVLAVVNTLLHQQGVYWLDIVLFVAMAYAYTQYSGL